MLTLFIFLCRHAPADDGVSIYTLMVAILAIIVSFVVLFKQLQSSRTETKTTTAVQLLNAYLEIVKGDKDNVLINKDVKVDKFWREMFDLQFTQFHLWLNGHIDDSMMAVWCLSRRKDYQKDKPNYRDTWRALSEPPKNEPGKNQYSQEDCYFPEELFVEFMNKVHSNSETIKKIFKDTRVKFKEQQRNL